MLGLTTSRGSSAAGGSPVRPIEVAVEDIGDQGSSYRKLVIVQRRFSSPPFPTTTRPFSAPASFHPLHPISSPSPVISSLVYGELPPSTPDLLSLSGDLFSLSPASFVPLHPISLPSMAISSPGCSELSSVIAGSSYTSADDAKNATSPPAPPGLYHPWGCFVPLSLHYNSGSNSSYHKLRDSNERNHSSGSVHYNSVVTPPDDIHHFAHYETKYGAYYGTRAKINLWGHPYLKRFQRSSTMLWVLNFDSGANVIEAGFHRQQFLNYKADGYQSTGCYNLQCKGFKMINWNILTPGDIIDNVSTYNGQQYYITLSIKKDPHTGDWWLYREDLAMPQ
uniref:Neprosin PEP catalytic domain-containing protein n=1 Tax=Ananas comosus var. bracteatus TaxID=296719 RepID=A0A6V7NJS6_ANACO|nr:unnamed protein product [Ananas comosus var. bracteatus]